MYGELSQTPVDCAKSSDIIPSRIRFESKRILDGMMSPLFAQSTGVCDSSQPLRFISVRNL